MLKLSPLVLASLLLAILLWSADSAAISGLLQVSPVESPSATTAPSDAASPEVTATAAITETAVPLETPTEALPTETVPPAATDGPEEPPAIDAPATPAMGETDELGSEESLRYPEGESKLSYDWGMFFDAVALFFSYVWLICGILLFLGLPVLLYFLWRAAERQQQEGPQGDDEVGEGDGEQQQG